MKGFWYLLPYENNQSLGLCNILDNPISFVVIVFFFLLFLDLGNFYQEILDKNRSNSSILSSILNNKSAILELQELTKNGTQNYWGSDFKCMTCKIDFRQKKHLTRHLRNECPETKGSDRPFLCPHCSFRSARKYNLKVHIANQHMKMIL